MRRVLFVCTENANRSQMAEGYARHHGGGGVAAWSAGSRPSGVVNPKAIDAMASVGIDLSGHTSKSLDSLPTEPWDAVVTMGCGDACPHLPATLRDDWALTDPRDLESDAYHHVRDEIATRVGELLARLRISPTGASLLPTK